MYGWDHTKFADKTSVIKLVWHSAADTANALPVLLTATKELGPRFSPHRNHLLVQRSLKLGTSLVFLVFL